MTDIKTKDYITFEEQHFLHDHQNFGNRLDDIIEAYEDRIFRIRLLIDKRPEVYNMTVEQARAQGIIVE